MLFSPYDDTQTRERPVQPTESGYNTSGFDVYRQGVEITTDRYRFMGTQPKIWSGETTGFFDFVTYGQSPGSIDGNVLNMESKYEDIPEFNPVDYISLGIAYPVPIVFNEGPSGETETTIEPLTIPFKKPTNEGPYYAHSVRGSFESGNEEGWIVKSTNVVDQFVDLIYQSDTRFFLDEGGDDFGNVIRESYVADVEQTPTPFDDLISFSLENEVQTTEETILEIVRDGFQTEGMSLLPYGKKSAPAGFSVYGLNAGRYGTDSIAYAGWSLGS